MRTSKCYERRLLESVHLAVCYDCEHDLIRSGVPGDTLHSCPHPIPSAAYDADDPGQAATCPLNMKAVHPGTHSSISSDLRTHRSLGARWTRGRA